MRQGAAQDIDEQQIFFRGLYLGHILLEYIHAGLVFGSAWSRLHSVV